LSLDEPRSGQWRSSYAFPFIPGGVCVDYSDRLLVERI
jgi:hypothetical protein